MLYEYVLPTNVTVKWGDGFIKMEGPNGKICKKIGEEFFLQSNNKLFIYFGKKSFKKDFYFVNFCKLIDGVLKGYSLKLKLNGVGFKVFLDTLPKKVLRLKIGYSHEIIYEIPSDIHIEISKSKGTIILIKGAEEARVHQIASEIRQLRMPDAYKGKGILYENEILVLKKGKKEGK